METRKLANAVAAYREGQIHLVFDLYKQLADAGHVESQIFVAWMLTEGVGCARNEAEAARYFERAAILGSPVGSFYLGRWLAKKGDHKAAYGLYVRASESGHIPSVFRLGYALTRGKGVDVDLSRAYQLLRAAAGGAASAGRAQYFYLPTANGPMPIVAVIDGSTFAVQSDHLNTPRQLTNASGQVAWQWPYSACGETKPRQGWTRFADLDVNPNPGNTDIREVRFNLRYPGQYADEESGLFYNYFRSYDSRLGRYSQPDPIGHDGGWNRFGYVDANPLGFSDRLATLSWEAACWVLLLPPSPRAALAHWCANEERSVDTGLSQLWAQICLPLFARAFELPSLPR